MKTVAIEDCLLSVLSSRFTCRNPTMRKSKGGKGYQEIIYTFGTWFFSKGQFKWANSCYQN